ncbi:circumsporozoite protein [Sphingomonas sp. NSE70-1]|uniref:Circumsporozoite protein n=2 Tax=Sphingomonas caseinilyticus TaxID=2908205 RepID=A0ABT0RWL9_9SPHN|nr:circumsporozoite protein [Sphingomonas caseinilyticus]
MMKKVALTVAVLALGLAACESKTEEAVENVAVENAVESDVNAAEVAVDNALDAAGNAVDNAGEAVENAADAAGDAATNAAQ